jgi:hypothetical protein
MTIVTPVLGVLSAEQLPELVIVTVYSPPSPAVIGSNANVGLVPDPPTAVPSL